MVSFSALFLPTPDKLVAKKEDASEPLEGWSTPSRLGIDIEPSSATLCLVSFLLVSSKYDGKALVPSLGDPSQALHRWETGFILCSWKPHEVLISHWLRSSIEHALLFLETGKSTNGWECKSRYVRSSRLCKLVHAQFGIRGLSSSAQSTPRMVAACELSWLYLPDALTTNK